MTLGQGIAQGAAQLGRGMEEFGANMGRLKTGAKVADSLWQHFNANADDNTPNPLGSADQWKSKSWGDKVASLQGYMQDQTNQLVQARIGDMQAQALQRSRELRDSGVAQSVMQRLTEKYNASDMEGTNVEDDGTPTGGGTASTMTPEVFNREFPQLYLAGGGSMDGLRKYGQFAKSTLLPTPDAATEDTFFKPTDLGQEIPGLPGVMRVPTGPKTSELRDKNGGQVVPQYDETTGQLLGHSILNGRGGATFRPVKAAGARFKMIPDPINPGQMVPTVEADNLDDFKAGMEALKQMGGGATPAPTKGQPDAPQRPTVTTKAQFDALPAGAQYLGKDGVTVYQKPAVAGNGPLADTPGTVPAPAPAAAVTADENGVLPPAAAFVAPKSGRKQLTAEQRAAQAANLVKATALQNQIDGMASQLKSGSVPTGGRGIRRMTPQEYQSLHDHYTELQSQLKQLQ